MAVLVAADVIGALGGTSAVAVALGLPRTTVAGWRRGRGLVPSWHVNPILNLARRRRVKLTRKSPPAKVGGDAPCVVSKSTQRNNPSVKLAEVRR